MPAEITSTVHVAATIPDNAEIRGTIGTLTLDVHPDGIDLAEVHQALGELLIAAGQHILSTGRLPNPSPGEGESGSPA